ncbi:PspC domain-containing protein [Pedococcus sp. KACC 23699]|uniref:PspC domain-containing protein n=1 Tax=Pedococcus sp. KACC 23699 TaxID=3149228 RepID=A0AAU7JWX6_9MICO
MTQTPGPTTGPTNDTNTSGLDRFFGWLRSIDLRRDGDDKWLAGVCSGIATRLGVDPIVIRAVLVLLVVMGGVGITVYLIAWAFLPNDKEDIVAERALRDGDVLGIVLLLVIGLSLVGGSGFAGDVPGMSWIWWVVLPVGLVVWLVTRQRNTAAAVPGGAATGAASGATSGATPGGTSSTVAAATGAPSTVTTPTEFPGAITTPYGAPTPPGSSLPPAPPTGPPPRPAKPPRAPRAPRRRSGGLAATLLIGGLAVAAYGLTSWAHQANHWSGSDQTVALCAALAVVGLGVLGLGITGRRSGLTGFVAVVLILVTWTASVVPDVTFGGGIGERVWRPSVTDTTQTYTLSVGSADLDLSQLPDNPDVARQVEARVGMGELRIRIPKNLTVELHSSVAAGQITHADYGSLDPLSPPTDQTSPAPVDTNDGRNVSTVQTFGAGKPDVVVDAHVGLGQILVSTQ